MSSHTAVRGGVSMVKKGGRRKRRRRPSSSAETVPQTPVSPLIHAYLHLRIDTNSITTLIKEISQKEGYPGGLTYQYITDTYIYIPQPHTKDNQITASNGVVWSTHQLRLVSASYVSLYSLCLERTNRMQHVVFPCFFPSCLVPRTQ